MRKKIIVLISILLVLPLLSGCYYHKSEKTEIHHVKDYLIHENGVEIWATSDDGKENGFFISKENVYPCEESSRVIAIRYTFINAFNFENFGVGDLKTAYLYLNKEEFKEYLKEVYGLQEENL